MSRKTDVWATIRNGVSTLAGMLGHFVAFLRLMLKSKAAPAAEVLALMTQRAACVDAVNRRKAPRPRFTLSFRLLWVALSTWLPDWRKLARVPQPRLKLVDRKVAVAGGNGLRCRAFPAPGRLRPGLRGPPPGLLPRRR